METAPKVGLLAYELYFPKTCVSQHQLEKFDKVSTGKYTVGLGQLNMSFVMPYEDVNSMALTVVSRLLARTHTDYCKIGRLQVGTQTIIDKSKSTKTVLMSLFKNNKDIEGVTSLNACYGATNAIFNALYWLASPLWDGRLAIVVAVDIASYQKGPARPTGGAGAIAMLLGRDPIFEFLPWHGTFFDDAYDFFKPDPSSEYPTVDGPKTITSYLSALENSFKKFKEKSGMEYEEIDYFCFHSPFYKMVFKAFSHLCATENKSFWLKEQFKAKVAPSLELNIELGNIYTGSLYLGLICLSHLDNVQGKIIGLFSYGSGLASTFFTGRFVKDPHLMSRGHQIYEQLKRRVWISPEEYDRVMGERKQKYGKAGQKFKPLKGNCFEGIFYLSEIDERHVRSYRFYDELQSKL